MHSEARVRLRVRWYAYGGREARITGLKDRLAKAIRRAPLAIVRGTALFFGAYSAVNSLGARLGGGFGADLWWIDLSGLGIWLAAPLTYIAAVLLVSYGVWPAASTFRRRATAASCIALAAVAASNVIGFYQAWGAGSIRPAAPVPFSAIVGAALLGVGLHAWLSAAPGYLKRADSVAAFGVAVALMLAFPIAHVLFFGTTDYRRPADVAVVLGARVHDDGHLSWSLEDRVQTAVELYDDGLVRGLVMSGGVGANGVDEASAMRDRAVELGVPRDVVLVDSMGVDTDATVADTVPLLAREGARRVLVVSQFYHLPRIKMAYRAAGLDVYTVPAKERVPITKTPLFVVREIPGFWVYWARCWMRDIIA